MENLNHRTKLLLFIIAGGVAAILSYAAVVLARQFVTNSSLCSGVVSDMSASCAFIGIIIPQFLIIAGVGLLVYLLFRKHFEYPFPISFFALAYVWYLSSAIGWLYNPINIVNGSWIFYVLLSLLGGLLFFLFYLYFVKLKIWLWLRLLLALVLLLILPLILLNIERELYAIFYTGEE